MARQQRPNVVFLLADNVGCSDISVYGGQLRTPNIDQMAREGNRFTNYTVELMCTPTRSALMTGRLPVRSGTCAVPLPGEGAYGLSPYEYTLANLLSDSGYDTAMFGKWHLGEVTGRLPTDKGFDEWWGIKNTTDEAGYSSYPLFSECGMEAPSVWSSRKGEAATPVKALDLKSRPELESDITERAIDYIKSEQRSDKPFFLYVGFTHLHAPYQAGEAFKGRSMGSVRADCLVELDHRVGQIRAALKQANLEENTIIVFSSDNAASQLAYDQGGGNGPWRGNFFTPPFEGAHRVPCIAVWPGKIEQGVLSTEIVSVMDWFPTLANLCSARDRIPVDRPIDGIDFTQHLMNSEEPSGRDHIFYYGAKGELLGVKWKSMKIVYQYCDGVDKPFVMPSWPLVFDLITDPAERYNMMDTRTDIHWVHNRVNRIIRDLDDSMIRYPNTLAGKDYPPNLMPVAAE